MDPKAQPTTTQAPVTPPAPEPVSAPAPTQPEAPAPKKGNRMLIVLAGIVVIAVLVLGSAGYLYFMNNKTTNVSYTGPATTAPTPTTKVSPTPLSSVNNSNDLNQIENEVNSTSESELQSDLDKATTEGNSL